MWRGKLIHALLGPECQQQQAMAVEPMCLPSPGLKVVVSLSTAARLVAGSISVVKAPRHLMVVSRQSLQSSSVPNLWSHRHQIRTTTTILPLSRLDKDIVHSTVFASAFHFFVVFFFSFFFVSSSYSSF
ncbi:hypothetical protein CGRA01v4_14589 [Colletotrichum graminicola]|nr:hypothetical protein CGRA01v4_14589 [Colletotrichum graminicola]